MDFVLQNLFWFALLVISGGGLLWITLGGDGNDLSQQDAVIMMNREHAIVVDVRESADFAAGHLPGARNITVESIEAGAGDLEKLRKRPCILYCERGLQAGKASKALTKRGFDRVYTLAGGIDAWRNAGMPIEN